jgi:hypothetical protein
MNESIEECRAEAKAVGIPWSWVVARKCELVKCEAEKREEPNEARRAAWESACHWLGWADSRRVWWRVGFQRCFPRITRTCECDYTSIPRYDRIAGGVFETQPEFLGGDVDELWDWLLNSPYEPWPPREKFYWQALNEILELQARPAEKGCAELVPF